VQEICTELHSNAPNAVRETKKLIDNVWYSHDDIGQAKNYCTSLIAKLRTGTEAQQRIKAFLEKSAKPKTPKP